MVRLIWFASFKGVLGTCQLVRLGHLKAGLHRNDGVTAACICTVAQRFENRALVSCRCDPIQTTRMIRVNEGEMKGKRKDRKGF